MTYDKHDSRLHEAMREQGLPRECLDRSVWLAGVGSLGSRIADLLIRMGIRELFVCDPDRIDEKDRVQGVFGPDTGELKVVAIQALARATGSPTKVVPLTLRCEALGPAVLSCANVVIAALDRLGPRLSLYGRVHEVGELAFIDTAVDGHRGRTTEIAAKGACYHCHHDFSRDELHDHAAGASSVEWSCRDQADSEHPTIAAPYVIEQVAAVTVGRTLHLLAGRGQVCESRLAWSAAGSPVWRHYQLRAFAGCKTCSGQGMGARCSEPVIGLEEAAAARDSLGSIEEKARRAIGAGALEVPRRWAAFDERPPDEIWSNEPAAHLGIPYGGRLRFQLADGSHAWVELLGDRQWLGFEDDGGRHAGDA